MVSVWPSAARLLRCRPQQVQSDLRRPHAELQHDVCQSNHIWETQRDDFQQQLVYFLIIFFLHTAATKPREPTSSHSENTLRV